MKNDYNDTNKSPLTLENNTEFLKHQSMLKTIPSNDEKVG